jgi:transposase-like protein
MQMRIRRAMNEYGELLKGIIEADETFIGGKNKNRHSDKKIPNSQGRSTNDKTPVIGIFERGGKIKAKKAKDTTGKTIKSFVNKNVQKGSMVLTDEWKSYNALNKDFLHYFINHSAGEYVNGDIHTNNLEGFWSLLKRGIIGQYHHIDDKYLDRYINEFCFRFNERQNNKIFELAIHRAVNL